MAIRVPSVVHICDRCLVEVDEVIGELGPPRQWRRIMMSGAPKADLCGDCVEALEDFIAMGRVK
jgi:hypothetical protein